jgi:predicted nuclease of predicted toxin-antitoxin system
MCSDPELWVTAQRESRFFITQDLDFADLRAFALGPHHGILIIRLRTPSRISLVARVLEIFQSEGVADWAGCFVVATEHKIRLLKPLDRGL